MMFDGLLYGYIKLYKWIYRSGAEHPKCIIACCYSRLLTSIEYLYSLSDSHTVSKQIIVSYVPTHAQFRQYTPIF